MFVRISTLLTFLIIFAVASLLQTQDAFGSKKGKGHGHDKVKVEFSATDDWSPVGTLGEITCSSGELTDNPDLYPIQPCPAGSNIYVRGATAEAWVIADDPRFTGMLTYTLNYNLEPDFTGSAWGTWSLEVETCAGTWEGVWDSKRTLLPDPGPVGMGVWIGKMKIVGHGSGGCVDGLKMKGTEIAATYSPIPLPYEMLLGLCDSKFCPAEGVITGEIKGPGRH